MHTNTQDAAQPPSRHAFWQDGYDSHDPRALPPSSLAAHSLAAATFATDSRTCSTSAPTTAFDPYRLEHFSNISRWAGAGYVAADARAYLGRANDSFNHPNIALDLRVPNTKTYRCRRAWMCLVRVCFPVCCGGMEARVRRRQVRALALAERAACACVPHTQHRDIYESGLASLLKGTDPT
jgi:hypothetical protein